MSEIPTNKNSLLDERQARYRALTAQLIGELDKKVIEREELVRLIVLAILSRSHIFLIGQPGVGKTYIIDIALRAIKGSKYFEYLVMAHTKPEEIFGTIRVLEDGSTEYNIEDSVLDSHFVMLDEMFKGRSEILNSLLGVTSNERVFHMRGYGARRVPLITLFGASNEFPSDDALDPFDDRLLLRYEVERIKDPENYKRFIRGDFDRSKEVNVELTIDDIYYIESAIDGVSIPDEIVEMYLKIKQNIIQERVRISDRKMITAMNRILKTSAYLNGRNHVDYSDLFLLIHIAWRDYTERRKVKRIVFTTIFGSDKEVEGLLADIERELVTYEGYLENEVGDFIYKREQVDSKSVEAYYNARMGEFDRLYRGFASLRDHLNKVETFYRFLKAVEKQLEENIFVLSFREKTFSQESRMKMYQLGKRVDHGVEIMETFRQNCPDPYSYMHFNANAILR